ncbi:TetR/AcrR family transcriptional regulator [Kibdelosporangium philippinense]|uniref:TetR/AcrR family transcriptional regulator n=1 Tax=Kibdelosporangium philippinense TaxID=211113 RepID=A0ABS8Z534_9PSEU|nr:TetR/AcrR family transcriptional regulator [Kibdelosporangium philippinense]MCE7001683.1 TetR/AcrR family transcriptional regulator [Kibdelosporangium philippinense]
MSTEYSGGDVTVSLRLLWGLDERPSRGPKPSLTVDKIAAAGIELADEEGLDALSMRRVAAKLGVGTMSLYRYVPSKAELIDVMLDRAIASEDTFNHMSGLEGKGWREKMHAIAHASRELYLRHNWLLHVSPVRRLLGPGALASFEYFLDVMAETTLTDAEKINTIGLIDGYVISATKSVIEAAQAAERTGVSDEDYWEAHRPFLEQILATGDYPNMVSMAPGTFEEAIATSFDYGLDRVLDGLELLINSRK